MRINEGGFTIIESMIYLAVSGVLFASALGIFTTQQRETQFSQSVRQFESTINGLVNDSSTGTYSNFANVRCQYSANVPLITSQVGSNAGDNDDCLFLGKAVQFGNGPYSPTPDENFAQLTVVGRNDITTGNLIYTDLFPAIAWDAGSPDKFIERGKISWGTGIKKAYYVDDFGAVNYIYGLAVLANQFGEATDASSEFYSGDSTQFVYAMRSNTAAQSISSSRIDESSLATGLRSPYNSIVFAEPPSPIIICLEGAHNQQASIEIGSNSFVLGAVNVNTTSTTFAKANFDPPAECLI